MKRFTYDNTNTIENQLIDFVYDNLDQVGFEVDIETHKEMWKSGLIENGYYNGPFCRLTVHLIANGKCEDNQTKVEREISQINRLIVKTGQKISEEEFYTYILPACSDWYFQDR